MNAEQIIEYIRTSEKKTPVKVYVWEKTPVAFPNCHEFPAGEGCKIVFGDWKDVKPVLDSNEFAHIEIENNCRNSAIPMLDMKDIPARIEPGAIIRDIVAGLDPEQKNYEVIESNTQHYAYTAYDGGLYPRRDGITIVFALADPRGIRR